jgi:hypothetical protein
MPFQYNWGSVTGRQHMIEGRNNQDGCCFLRQNGIAVGVVTDGCGSEPHAEVGARAGAEMTARVILRACRELFERTPGAVGPDDTFWSNVRSDLLGRLRQFLEAIGGPFSENLYDYGTFTTLVAAITPTFSLFLACGDGVIKINEKVFRLGPFENNAPPYPAYALLTPCPLPIPDQLFQVIHHLPTPEVKQFLLSTDGGEYLYLYGPEVRIPGTNEPLGTLDQFLQDAAFRDDRAIVRRLQAINRDAMSPDGYEVGLLPDDTTVLVGRQISTDAEDETSDVETIRPSSPS